MGIRETLVIISFLALASFAQRTASSGQQTPTVVTILEQETLTVVEQETPTVVTILEEETLTVVEQEIPTAVEQETPTVVETELVTPNGETEEGEILSVEESNEETVKKPIGAEHLTISTSLMLLVVSLIIIS